MSLLQSATWCQINKVELEDTGLWQHESWRPPQFALVDRFISEARFIAPLGAIKRFTLYDPVKVLLVDVQQHFGDISMDRVIQFKEVMACRVIA